VNNHKEHKEDTKDDNNLEILMLASMSLTQKRSTWKNRISLRHFVLFAILG
jgi:hypothetical protein